ncbi:MAG: hypothetical protein E7321_01525 [Clostridiales bacterium]|nr:hypothetical protein [Clostridiales bacterium]
MNDMKIKTVENIEEYLIHNSGYNTASKNLSCCNYEGYLCEILTEDHSYFMKIIIDENINHVILQVYPGIRVKPQHYAKAVQYCMKVTDKLKVGNLRIKNKRGDVYYHISAPIVDAPVTAKQLESMEEIAIFTLLSHEEELERIANGLLEENDSDAEGGDDTLDLIKLITDVDDEDFIP